MSTPIGMQRRCRSEACRKWTTFKLGDDAVRCGWCGTAYGKPGLGDDVPLYAQPKAKAAKKPAKTMKLVDVPAPKPGEFGARR